MTVATSAVLKMKNVAAASRMPGRSSGARCGAGRGSPVASCMTAPAAAMVIAYCAMLNATFLSGLRRMPSGSRLAPASARDEASGPAAIIAASAKQVEVVTSPSAPRVKTFSGRNSPTRAKSAKMATSGDRSNRRSPAPSTPSRTAHAAPITMIVVTYRSSGSILAARALIGISAWRNEGAVPRAAWPPAPSELPLAAVTDLHGSAPLEAGAQPLEEDGHDTRDEREAVQACLHHFP